MLKENLLKKRTKKESQITIKGSGAKTVPFGQEYLIVDDTYIFYSEMVTTQLDGSVGSYDLRLSSGQKLTYVFVVRFSSFSRDPLYRMSFLPSNSYRYINEDTYMYVKGEQGSTTLEFVGFPTKPQQSLGMTVCSESRGST